MLSLVQNKGVLGREGVSREGFFWFFSRRFVEGVGVSKTVVGDFLGLFFSSFSQGFSQGFSGFLKVIFAGFVIVFSKKLMGFYGFLQVF